MKEKKQLSIHDFPIVNRWDDEYGWVDSGIRWEDCEKILGKREYKRFCKYMIGSTTGQDGVYTCDLRAFLRDEDNLD